MSGKIKKLQFKKDAALQIEVVPLQVLTNKNKRHLIKPHRTDFYHIFLLENCRPVHYVDFEQIKTEPYTLLFIDKNRVHQFDPSLNYKGQVIIFTDDFFIDVKLLRNSILFNGLSDISLKPPLKDFKRFAAISQSISEELTQPAGSDKQILLKNYLHNFLILAEREKRKHYLTTIKKGPDLDYTLHFRDLLETNFAAQKAVSDYAARIFISEKRLGQATQAILGKSPKSIISERILLEAKRLLVHSNLSVKEVGMELGFADPGYFVRYFKKNSKSTPAQFRHKYLVT
jgi:AraC-like DNA-binding protein